MRAATALPLAALLAIGAGCGGDEPTAGERRADQARDLAEEAGLPEDVGDLLALAAGAVDATYRVTYEDAGGGTLTVTSGPAGRRLDVTAVEPGSTEPVTRSQFALDDGAFTCTEGADRWFCAQDDRPPELPGPFAEGDLARTIDALRQGADDFDLRVEEREIAGVTARCLVADAAGGPTGSLCVSPDGVPLLLERSGDDLVAIAYTTDVPDDALELPADPETGTSVP